MPEWIDKVVLAVQVGASVAALVMTGLLKPDSIALAVLETHIPYVQKFATWLGGSGWWLLPSTVLTAGLVGLYRKISGPAWLWATVHSYLDSYRSEVFSVEDGDASHHHRVTLYRRVRWWPVYRRWPGSGWLIPKERSGHTTRRRIAYFRAPDDADAAEGIAGRAWACQNEVVVLGLPELRGDSPDSVFDSYATNTGVTAKWLRKKLPKARSYCGIPLEVKGTPWGVIVLDSRNPAGIPESSRVHFRPLARILGKLLERV